jgi:HEAT repeat protein
MRREAARLLAGAAASDRAPPGARARVALEAALADDTPLVAATAARALGAIGGAQGALARGLSAASALVRDACAYALRGAEKDVAVVNALRALLGDGRPGVRGAAAVALGAAGVVLLEQEGRDALARLLDDSDPYVRSAAASTFGALGAAASERLSRMLGDVDPRVRLAAARVLVRSAPHREDARRALESLATSRAPVREGDAGELKSVGEVASSLRGGAVE